MARIARRAAGLRDAVRGARRDWRGGLQAVTILVALARMLKSRISTARIAHKALEVERRDH
jgi:hypothetical protein